MKVPFFLTPKSDVAWILASGTVRQAIERMELYRYTAVPVLTADGKYDGTLTEGDVLWFIKQHPHLTFEDMERVRLTEVSRRLTVTSIHVDAEIDELLDRAIDQNFVPVVDDRDAFIGIVRRRAILEYFKKEMLRVVRS